MKSNYSVPGAILAALIPVVALAGLSPAIGIVTAVGTFTVNNSRLEGNANVFDGSKIDTDRSSTQVFIQDGPWLMLGTNSSATVFRDHMLLTKGAAKLDRLRDFKVQALGYAVQGSDVSSKALVRLQGNELQIASLAGNLQVFNAKGALLTRVGAGSSALFSPNGQTGAMVADQSGAMNENHGDVTRQVLGYSATGAGLAVLGLSVDAGLQRHPTSP